MVGARRAGGHWCGGLKHFTRAQLAAKIARALVTVSVCGKENGLTSPVLLLLVTLMKGDDF